MVIAPVQGNNINLAFFDEANPIREGEDIPAQPVPAEPARVPVTPYLVWGTINTPFLSWQRQFYGRVNWQSQWNGGATPYRFTARADGFQHQITEAQWNLMCDEYRRIPGAMIPARTAIPADFLYNYLEVVHERHIQENNEQGVDPN